ALLQRQRVRDAVPPRHAYPARGRAAVGREAERAARVEVEGGGVAGPRAWRIAQRADLDPELDRQARAVLLSHELRLVHALELGRIRYRLHVGEAQQETSLRHGAPHRHPYPVEDV